MESVCLAQDKHVVVLDSCVIQTLGRDMAQLSSICGLHPEDTAEQKQSTGRPASAEIITDVAARPQHRVYANGWAQDKVNRKGPLPNA